MEADRLLPLRQAGWKAGWKAKPMNIMLILTLLSIILGQLARIPFWGVAQGILPTDLLVGLALLAWIIKKALQPSLPAKHFKNNLTLPLVLVWIWFFISLIWGGLFLNLEFNQFSLSFFFLIRLIAYSAIFYLARETCKKPCLRRMILCSIKVSILVLALLGFIQLIFYPDLSPLTSSGWDPHQNRLVSTWLDPNFLGALLIIGICLFAVQPPHFSKLKKQQLKFFSHYLYLGVLLAALLLTFSRSSYLMLAISLFVLAVLTSITPFQKIKKPRSACKYLLLGLISLFILGLVFIPRARQRIVAVSHLDQTSRFRIESWKNSLQIAKKNLIIGTGFNAFRFAQEKYGIIQPEALSHSSTGADSSLLLVLADTGIPGLLLFLWLYGTILNLAWQKWKKKKNSLSLAVLAILISLFFHSQFVNSLFYPHLMVIVWILVGLI